MRSRKTCWIAVAAAALLGEQAPAASYPAQAEVRFHGTSTLHDFDGSVTPRPFTITRDDASFSARVHVRVADMTTANAKRDGKMRTMLSAPRFGEIVGIIEDAPIPQSADARIPLRLRIRDREQTLQARVVEWGAADGIAFRLEFSLSLAAFALAPPSVLGMIRVGDTVAVSCTVFTPPSTGTSKEAAHAPLPPL